MQPGHSGGAQRRRDPSPPSLSSDSRSPVASDCPRNRYLRKHHGLSGGRGEVQEPWNCNGGGSSSSLFFAVAVGGYLISATPVGREIATEPLSAVRLRVILLENFQVVVLDALLTFAWSVGIPVVQMRLFPIPKAHAHDDGPRSGPGCNTCGAGVQVSGPDRLRGCARDRSPASRTPADVDRGSSRWRIP